MFRYFRNYFIFFIGLLVLLAVCSTTSLSEHEYIVLNHKYPASDFKKIDEYILSLNDKDEESVESIALAIDSTAKTEWEKVRGIWIWITHNIAYDVDGYFNGNAIYNGINAFEEKRAVCSGYSKLFLNMANKLNIDAYEVNGYAKGYGFSPGTSPEGTNHSWIIVRIDNKSHLFDTTWGAGSLRNKKFHWSYKEIYFDIQPELFIFNHFPENADCQLLDEPINRATYFRLPNVKSTGLSYGVDLKNVLGEAKNGKSFTSPTIYRSKIQPQYMSIPIQEKLKSGLKYHFIIEAETDRVVIVNGNSDPAFIEKNDGIFDFKYKAKPGELQIGLTTIFTSSKRSWSYILKYSVE